MNVVLSHPVFARLQQDMQRMGLAGADTANVTDLHDVRVRREREASERRYADKYGIDSDFTPGSAA